MCRRIAKMLPVISLAACSATARFIQADQIELDPRKAGTVTYRELVELAWVDVESKLQSAPRDHAEDREVALVGIDARGAEELGEDRHSMLDMMADKITNSGLFVVVNQNMVHRALQEIGSNDTRDLFLKKYRTEFLSQLAEGGITPGFLVFADLSTSSSRGKEGLLSSPSRYRTYHFSMTLVDARTGEEVARGRAERTKEYYRSL
jgi:hypothetical protein